MALSGFGGIFLRVHRFIIFVSALILGIYIGSQFCQTNSPEIVMIGEPHLTTQQLDVAQQGKNPVALPGKRSNARGAGRGGANQRNQPDAGKPCTYPPLAPGKHRLAIIVPFRDGCDKESQGGGRLQNLREFVPYMKKFLSAQSIEFEIFIVEQVKRGLFNKGFLFNTGFLLARENFDYIALHDVDQVPENPENLYSYPSQVTHLCVANSRTKYVPAYEGMVGGVLLMTREHYDAVNGFSNTYWTWGQEDDDMYNRLRGVHGTIARPSAEVGRYRALDHARVEGLDETPRFKKQREELHVIINASLQGRKATEDVVMKNGFRQVKYNIVSANCTEHYSHYVVDYLNPNQPMDAC